VHADRRQRALDRRDPLRPPGSTPLTDSERYLLWTIGKVAALATHARIATRNQELAKQLQERIDLAREIHDASSSGCSACRWRSRPTWS
jgi:hypothetical protein